MQVRGRIKYKMTGSNLNQHAFIEMLLEISKAGIYGRVVTCQILSYSGHGIYCSGICSCNTCGSAVALLRLN